MLHSDNYLVMLKNTRDIVLFALDERRYGLDLDAVQRILRIVDITPLPGAPDIVLGVINVHGEVVPVMNMRKRFGLFERELRLTDHLIIAKTSTRTVGLAVDEVLGLLEVAESEVVKAAQIVPGVDYVEGVLKLPDQIVLIHDLDTFLSLEEERGLKEVMSEAAEEAAGLLDR
jgi:purine-binding chemotaxis protein CheW